MFIEPEQTAVGPEIAPGIAGVIVAVTASICGVLEQAPSLAVTVMLPLVAEAVGVAIMELVVELPVHPAGKTQV